MSLLQNMALFVEVAKHNSFSKAADLLDMPVSSVSRRISDLEKEIGVKLFHRTTRKVELTEMGHIYFNRTKTLVDEAQQAHEDLEARISNPEGTVRITATTDFAYNYLAPVLVDFQREYPHVDIVLELSPNQSHLLNEHIDVALRIGQLKDSNLIARHLMDLPQGLFASPTYLREHGTPLTPHDLTLHQCLRMHAHDEPTIWTLIDHHTPPKAESVTVSGRLTANAPSVVQQLILLNAGIGILDCALSKPMVESGTLVRVLPDWCMPAVPLHLITPSRMMPAKTRVFVEFLKTRLGHTHTQ